MNGKLFIPYIDGLPLTLNVKGHRVMIASESRIQVEDDLEELGADQVRELEITNEDASALADLAHEIHGGVVVIPAGVSVSFMVKNLESELPWVH